MGRPSLHVALVLLVVSAGCSFFGPDPPRDERAVAALGDARRAVADVDAYRYHGDLQVVGSGDSGTERVTIQVAGVVDVAGKRANSTAEREGRTYGSYLVNRTRYRECARPRGSWGVEEVSIDGDWASQTPVHRQLSLLETGVLRHAGGATVRGEDATLLVGEPSGRALRQYQKERGRPLIGGPQIRNPRVRVWIDNETSLALRTSLEFEVEGGDSSATATMTMDFEGYGEPATIELPADVREDIWETGCPGS